MIMSDWSGRSRRPPAVIHAVGGLAVAAWVAAWVAISGQGAGFEVIAADRQTAVVVDLSEQLAGKTALQEAAAKLAERLLPKLVKK